LKEEGVPFKVAREDLTTDSQTLNSRVLFLQSDSDHYGVVSDRGEFRKLLEASPVLTFK